MFDIEDTTPPDPFTVWFNQFEAALQDFQTNYLIYDTNFNPDKSLTIKIPKTTNILGILGRTDTNGTILEDVKPAKEEVTDTSSIFHSLKTQALLNAMRHQNRVPTTNFLDGTLSDSSFRKRVRRNVINGLPEVSRFNRVKRQTILDVPIPVSPAFYPGEFRSNTYIIPLRNI